MHYLSGKNSGQIRAGGLCWEWPLRERESTVTVPVWVVPIGSLVAGLPLIRTWTQNNPGLNICRFSVLTLGKYFPFWYPCRNVWLICSLGKNWMFLKPPTLCYCTVWCAWLALLIRACRGRCSFHIVVLTVTYPFIYIVSSIECTVSNDMHTKNIGEELNYNCSSYSHYGIALHV